MMSCTWSVLLKSFVICGLTVLCSVHSIANAQLLVADRATGQITKYDALTGDYQGVLVSGDPAVNGGLFAPSAMTIGPNNELYIASLFGPERGGSVLRYDINSGEFLGNFVEGLTNGPSGLLYNAERDEMLVSTLGNFDSDLILRYKASTGEFLSNVGEGTGMSGRSGIGYGPDGNLYASSFANGEFFTGAVLQFDGDSLAPLGSFALEPFLSGASGFQFRPTEDDGAYQLDLVGLFSNNVARFNLATTDGELAVESQSVLISEGLDFPSAIADLGDGTMIVTSLGNDNPETGDLRPGSIGRFDVASGDFIDTFIAAGGEGSLAQPSAILLLPAAGGLDCNGDGVVDVLDLSCVCGIGVDDKNSLLTELNLINGDFDANGEVGFTDFLLLSKAFGTEADYSEGDMDCNGIVEFADFLAFSANFGQTSAVAASVPEPSSISLLLLGMLFLRRNRRRS